jgi:putative transposase
MPRFARVVIPDCPHHITQRGNNRQDVFFVEDDYHVYLELLAEQADRFGLRLDGYCLMPNHIHLIATPRSERALAKAVGRTHFRYTQYVNRMHGRSGHLWQNRFFSCPLDAPHLQQAMAYVERNPVKARMHRKAWLYPWSSAAWHCGEQAEPTVPLSDWPIDPQDWKAMLTQADDDRDELIRVRTQTGRPLGTDRFVSKLESSIGRRLRPLPVGRPKKNKKNKKKTK